MYHALQEVGDAEMQLLPWQHTPYLSLNFVRNIYKGQPRAFRQGEVLRHFQDFREKFWSEFWISLYI